MMGSAGHHLRAPGQEYDVILQAAQGERAAPADLDNLYVRSRDWALVPCANLVTLAERAEAGSLNRFNRLRAITLSAGLAPGYTLGARPSTGNATARDPAADRSRSTSQRQSREYLPVRRRGAVHLRDGADRVPGAVGGSSRTSCHRW